ncbi:MAG TPA: ATP-binding cassette domain-containing protein, partial [Burkholderiales bacterium]|nr:ATP-binding cassette domain-containing protein [Burkholderiales bacterium]
MLEARELKVSYGAAPAVNGVSLKVEPGALAVVVGPNGAGKTTLINAIAGVQRVEAGTLAMDGLSLNGVPPHRFCEHGIALVPEGRRLFTALTVRENLELGGYRAAARARRAQTLREVCTL